MIVYDEQSSDSERPCETLQVRELLRCCVAASSDEQEDIGEETDPLM